MIKSKYENQVECQSVEEALEASSAGADIVMLDNFTASALGQAAKYIKTIYPNIIIEASGVSHRLFFIILVFQS